MIDAKQNNDLTINYGNYNTNFQNIETKSYSDKSLYGLDSNGRLHLDLIPGVLKLSSRQFKTTKVNGSVMKEFEPAFGYFPVFMVKTDKLKDYDDKYVIVRIIHTIDKLSGQGSITGTVERYIGNVGDTMVEKDLCKIMGTAHWKRSVDKMKCFDEKILHMILDKGSIHTSNIDTYITELEKIGIILKDQTPCRRLMEQSTERLTISVDPQESKDIDDAISIEIKNSNNVLIGIHIADPSSFLIEGSVLDQEVAKRAESIYLNDQTFHMFPEGLSSSVFSLIENRLNRAFSVLLELSRLSNKAEWKITAKTVAKTQIYVDRNMSYDNFQKEYASNLKMHMMYEIGKELHVRMLNPQKLVTYDAKKMIEIYMVLANCFVAEEMVQRSDSNYDFPVLIRSQKPSEYVFDNKFFTSSCTDEKQQFLSRLIDEHVKLHMKSAQLKYYSKSCEQRDMNSHDSLGLSLYTHFTSPIRRYSDILVHRIMNNMLFNDKTTETKFTLKCIDKSDLHQLFVMNHYKQFYNYVSHLEQELLITHHYIDTVGKIPMNRIQHLSGIVVDTMYEKDASMDKIHKIKIKCTGINRDALDKEESVDPRLDLLFKNMIHTVTIPTVRRDDDEMESSGTQTLELFNPINYKVCYLVRDVRKIRPFL